MKTVRLILLTMTASLATLAGAVEPGHYGPGDGSGHGVFVNCNRANECAVFWFNHLSPTKQVWLMGVPNCARGPDEVCDVSLTRPRAPRFSGGEVAIGEAVGTLELTPMQDGSLAIDWDVRALRPDECFGITPGGVIFRRCVGTQRLHLIAGNPPANP